MTVDSWSQGREKWSSQEKGYVVLYDIKGHLQNNVKTLTSNLNTDLMTMKEATTSQLQVSR